ncbi:hypothetical protein SAMN05421505_13523 [Sinosporangium album]|uniref:Uncharacterized protein n=1 Tax=Sinosporangium album TaxID=504805 RepID=A0A1G8I435_9ACTN|nr:hypothetical protein [Sinosporangium album]SDI13688.1 hypothetical protein SAMN05421505_13523 [Sinosporangium album]
MTWILVAAGLVGLAVIAVPAVRVALAARGLAKEIERSRALLAPRQALLREKIGANHPTDG